MFDYISSSRSDYPSYNIEHSDDHSMIYVYVPGLDRTDIKIESKPLIRCIYVSYSGEKKQGRPILYNGFSLQFSLRQTHDMEGITAKYDKGVLEIRVPFQAELNVKQIKIE